jgi:hypothetical protein
MNLTYTSCYFLPFCNLFCRRYQNLLDRTVVHIFPRWAVFAVLLLIYILRVYSLQGWYIVTYGLGIYLLNLFIGFITPAVRGVSSLTQNTEYYFIVSHRNRRQVDPLTAEPLLPTKNADTGEFRPFSRKLPEFKFWFVSCFIILSGKG